MRSLKHEMWGETNIPVFKFIFCRAVAVLITVEPFPFVPAMCTASKAKCGFPNLDDSSSILFKLSYDLSLGA